MKSLSVHCEITTRRVTVNQYLKQQRYGRNMIEEAVVQRMEGTMKFDSNVGATTEYVEHSRHI